jgi:hypothetical protein
MFRVVHVVIRGQRKGICAATMLLLIVDQPQDKQQRGSGEADSCPHIFASFGFVAGVATAPIFWNPFTGILFEFE